MKSQNRRDLVGTHLKLDRQRVTKILEYLKTKFYINELDLSSKVIPNSCITRFNEQQTLRNNSNIAADFQNMLETSAELARTHDIHSPSCFAIYELPSEKNPQEEWTRAFIHNLIQDLTKAGIHIIDRAYSETNDEKTSFVHQI